MMLETASLAVIGYITYSMYFSKGESRSITETLNEKISNGYQFRDNTYNDTIDVAHPDVKNNGIVLSGLLTADRGVNGLKRGYSQLYSGTSELVQLYRTDNLYL